MNAPGNDERRPGRGGVAVEQLNNQAEVTAPQGPMSSPRSLHALRGPRHTTWLTGSPSVRPLLRRLDVPTMYDRPRQAWAIPTTRLDDVLVYADHVDRRFVTVEDAA